MPAPEGAALYCEVALPVILDGTFTYELHGLPAVVGGRVLVGFGRGREKTLSGIVTRLHSEPPEAGVKLKPVLQVIDTEAALDAALLELGRWIAQYYIAPLGEVYRAMLPLQGEFRKERGWRITARGSEALCAALGGKGPNSIESEILNYLDERDLVREATLRSATGCTLALLSELRKKKWVESEDLSGTRESKRTERFIVRTETTLAGKRNDGQQRILQAVEEAGGRIAAASLRGEEFSASSLQTLVKRGALRVEEAELHNAPPAMKPRLLDFELTASQQKALKKIEKAVAAHEFSVTLLEGVTGSGKTAVYLWAMQHLLEQGRGALLLVPEIGLTPSMAADMYSVFGDKVAVLHSSMSNDERAAEWRRLRSGEARIAVGTRSAIFAPVRKLALIIVDEEHDHSYKQEETPRYQARDVAAVRARGLGAAVVLGSATPSLESYLNATVHKKYHHVALPERVHARELPPVEVVDMREEYRAVGKECVLSRRLVEELEACLKRGEQSMVLLNRRGYSSFMICRQCGDTLQCRDCAVAMTYHKARHRMICHCCGWQQPVPKSCAKCGSEYVQFFGSGSEKLEALLREHFPQARIARMDRDTVRGHDAFEQMLTSFQAGEIDILAGTQMIAKGHDMPGVTLVGVVGADNALGQPDFRAAERTFQLLTQVEGRCGRGDVQGRVVLQSCFPEHYAVQFAAAQDYTGFAEKELGFRRAFGYPPFAALANVLVRSAELDEALRYSGELGKWFAQQRVDGLRVMGPAAAPIVRMKKDYRYHFLLKSASRPKLNALLRAMMNFAAQRKFPLNSLIVDVDAQTLM
jgi:primosomal protein N' (replication factor Y)